jgi:undecaprenyl diphosphate synthase
VAVSPDGNGRWAQARGLPRSAGHEQGTRTFTRLVGYALELGIPYLTVYAWSTENWGRPREETEFLFGLYENLLRDSCADYVEHGVRVTQLGRRGSFPDALLSAIKDTEAATAGGTALRLQLCIDYGGRAELADAARDLARSVAAGHTNPEDVDEHYFAQFLYCPDLPDVDLLIRTSGEQRTSNFMPWQSVYAELLFPEVLWPDFALEHLRAATDEYARRQRRFGTLH